MPCLSAAERSETAISWKEISERPNGLPMQRCYWMKSGWGVNGWTCFISGLRMPNYSLKPCVRCPSGPNGWDRIPFEPPDAASDANSFKILCKTL